MGSMITDVRMSQNRIVGGSGLVDEPKRVGALEEVLEALYAAGNRTDLLIDRAEHINANLFGALQPGPATEDGKAQPAPEGVTHRLGMAVRYLNQRLERLYLELERLDNL